MSALRAEAPEDLPASRVPALIRLARPKQWIKNVLVIAAPGAAGVLGDPTALFNTAIAFAWIAGIVSFVVVVSLGNDLILRNELAFLAGGVVAALAMALLLFPRMRRGGATLEDLVQIVEHETLEI